MYETTRRFASVLLEPTVPPAATAPSIVTQPVAQSVTEPAAAASSIAASGTDPLSYQRRSSANGTDWTNISGATGATAACR
ncbi:MAG: hypothetical protein WDO68_02260 [Gammaproteobacteria bacterium]